MTIHTFAMTLCLLLCGCGVTATGTNQKLSKDDPSQPSFDSKACADALAHQAELANTSPAFKASEVLDGILHQATDCGIPKEFVTQVRATCPAIGATPATDLSSDQVAAIRGVGSSLPRPVFID